MDPKTRKRHTLLKLPLYRRMNGVLTNERNLSDLHGQTMIVKAATAEEFYERINIYIDSNTKGSGVNEPAYWPLV